MPSNKKYNDDDLLNAVAAIKNGNSTYREVSQKYSIPISTLCDRIKQRAPLHTEKRGKKICLRRSFHK